ncbi:MAG: hypothetical protein V1647_04880 [Pseudomonadota bacterium]
MKIGFVGVPPLKKITEIRTKYPEAKWFDLDVPSEGISKNFAVNYIPETTCSIIQTILANIYTVRPDIFIAVTGGSKCDSVKFMLPIIQRLLPDTRIVECQNSDSQDFGFPVCTSGIPLAKKFEIITNNVLNPEPAAGIKSTTPTAGFWGVPPYDYSILSLFPDNTHVFGWTRCMENKTPDNINLELFVQPELPTVFFSQSFCQKNVIAKELAHLHKGLYVEVDGLIDSSTRAKIAAFLELRNCY